MVNETIELVEKNVLSCIHRAVNLEGFNTSIDKVKKILDNVPVETTYNEAGFIVGMKKGWDLILEDLGEPNDIVKLGDIHEACLSYKDTCAGTIRCVSIVIDRTINVQPLQSAGEIDEVLERYSLIENPLTRALTTFCYVCYIQPYIEGNLRVAQLIANKILIENSIGFLSIPMAQKSIFMDKLNRYYETKDSMELLNFLLVHCITYTDKE